MAAKPQDVITSDQTPVTLVGGDGNDQFHYEVEGGQAVMYGGKGDDTFYWWEDAHITVYGGDGSDTIDTSEAALGMQLTVDLRAGQAGGPVTSDGGFVFPAGDVFLAPIVHSSAEELARYLWDELHAALLAHGALAGVRTLEISVAEGPGQAAIFRKQTGSPG